MKNYSSFPNIFYRLNQGILTTAMCTNGTCISASTASITPVTTSVKIDKLSYVQGCCGKIPKSGNLFITRTRLWRVTSPQAGLIASHFLSAQTLQNLDNVPIRIVF